MTIRSLRLIRIKEVSSKTGNGKSSIYSQIEDALQVPPVKIGPRASAWVEYEVDAVNAARMAGKSDGEIRALVKTLTAKRQQIAHEILSAT